MSEQQNCPECGAQMTVDPNSVEFSPSPLKSGGRAPLVCTNPDCPTNDTDLAPLGKGQEWLNKPGTEGGANGGA